MPPQAKEFRSNQSSYLMTKEENRPWNFAEEEELMLDLMRQEEHPMKKGTSIDSHFQARVNRRKSAYRSILQGETVADSDDSGSFRSDRRGNDAVEDSAVSKAEIAREARQRRLQNKPAVDKLHAEQHEATVVRTLRAHRLRNSLKPNVDEDEVMAQMQRRRELQLEQDKLAQEREELEKAKEEARKEAEANQLKALQEERLQLAEERRLLEHAKWHAAMELERRKEMLELRQDPSPENSVNSFSVQQEVSEIPMTPRRRRKSRKSKNTIFNDLTFVEEIQEAFRDAGVIKMCVGSCFDGDLDDVEIEESPRRRRSTRRE